MNDTERNIDDCIAYIKAYCKETKCEECHLKDKCDVYFNVSPNGWDLKGR